MGNDEKRARTARLKELINRKDRVLAVQHAPSVAHARLMDMAGCEAGFVGTSTVVGSYTGLGDVGTATMTECVMIAGWIARSVKFPIILDGDTGFGGIMAVRRLVRECIEAGVAGLRLDDQPIEGKRQTLTEGLEVVSRAHAIARYRAAVDMRNELDPNFVIMAQCYARDASNGGFDVCLDRLRAYELEGGVDWVQFEAPHSIEEIRQARAVVKGPMSFMKGRLPKYLDLDEHLALGVNIAWYPIFIHEVAWAAVWDYMQDFQKRGLAAWVDFRAARKGRKFPNPTILPDDGESFAMQRKLEEKYFPSEDLAKYRPKG